VKIVNLKHLEDCKLIHNNYYDYSLSIYKNVLDKIKIICPEHGIFEQRLSHHKNGSICPECLRYKKSLTKNEFVNKANVIHNFKYNYEIVDYKNHMKKIKIICTEHGIFEQTPNNHLKGKGCPKCCKNRIYSKDEIIEKANKKHNYKYDYSLSEFKNMNNKIKIICPIHGIFNQNLYQHLNISGCPKCNKVIMNTEHFINLSNNLHKNKYDYSHSIFVKMRNKIKIICPKHGIFYQYPLHHINGCGCPKCTTRSKGEEIIENFLIENNIKYETQKKFKDCKYKKTLRFDFYLIDFNMCIEYDGELHYKEVEYFGGKERLNDTLIKDKIKNDYCNKKSIKLLRIKYNEDPINKIKTILNFI